MPEDDNWARKHLRFQKMDIERARHKTQRVPNRPPKDNVVHGQELVEAVTIVQRQFQQSTTSIPPEFNPDLIFRIKLDGLVTEDDWRRSGLSLLSEEPEGYVVLFSEDQLNEFQRRVQRYGDEIPEEHKAPSYAWIASLTADMAVWSREDRIGKKLRPLELQDAKTELKLDVELWNYGNRDDNIARMASLREFVEHNGGRFLDHYMGSSLNLARIAITGDVLDVLLDVPIIQGVDLPPQPSFTIGRLATTPLDSFPTPVPSPPDGTPGICILDSGINTGHPMLGPAIGYTQAVPAALGSGVDEHGHGTLVAGIALYGDVQRCIEDLTFEPEFWLYGARVTNAENRFDDERLIVNQMHEAISYFWKEYGCRVFNVSLGDPDLVYNGGKPSPWAQILDTLAHDLDVVIIVSAGNYPIIGAQGQRAEQLLTSYPHYLLDQDARIIEPATAANVLTVGSLANSDRSALMVSHPDDPAIRCIAQVNEPSPFTRSGPGVNRAIKPEICDYGGNAVWDGRLKIVRDRDSEVSIVSTNFRHLEKLFSTDVGTSFAAPRATYLAGRILVSYPGVSANLVRALIANSADTPAGFSYGLSEDQLLSLCGYGKPDPERALFSAANRVTMIAEDLIPLDTLHLYEIPIPDDLKSSRGKRRISVSLAYDPPVRHTRKDYLSTKMSFRLFRGMTMDRIVGWFAERDGDVDPDRIPDRYQCQMSPLPNRRENGTLQKATFLIAQNRMFDKYEGDAFHLLVRCQNRWASVEETPNQRYALAVTIEHLEQMIPLYATIQQRVQVSERVRVRA